MQPTNQSENSRTIISFITAWSGPLILKVSVSAYLSFRRTRILVLQLSRWKSTRKGTKWLLGQCLKNAWFLRLHGVHKLYCSFSQQSHKLDQQHRFCGHNVFCAKTTRIGLKLLFTGHAAVHNTQTVVHKLPFNLYLCIKPGASTWAISGLKAAGRAAVTYIRTRMGYCSNHHSKLNAIIKGVSRKESKIKRPLLWEETIEKRVF